MKKRRVVITGIGCVSPYGTGVVSLIKGIINYTYPLTVQKYLDREYVVGRIPNFNEKSIPREHNRTMPRMGKYAYEATLEALNCAEIYPDLAYCTTISTIIASGYGSADVSEKVFKELLETGKIKSISASLVLQMLGNITASNVASAFGFKGRCIAPAAACAGGIQSVITAYESMLLGKTDVVVCGGAEEFHNLTHMTFLKLGIASTGIDPSYSSVPFDTNRTGVVCSEGAGIFVLEEFNKNRKDYFAEIVGVGTNNSTDMVYSNKDSILDCMKEALDDANLRPSDIDFINTHATGTPEGDVSEGLAISELFPHKPYVNILKGYLGHTMAASGAIELIANIASLNKNIWFGVSNLKSYDTKCGDLNINTKHITVGTPKYLLKNSFGLGGINTTIIVKLNKGE